MKRATPIPFLLLLITAIAILIAPTNLMKVEVKTGGEINSGDV